MKILVFAPMLPWPLDSGDTLRIYNIFRELSKRHSVYLLYFANPDNDKDAENLKLVEESGIFEECIPLGISLSLVGRAAGMLSPRYRIGYLRSRMIVAERIKHIVREKAIDVIHSHGARNSLLITDINDIPRLLDLTDSASLYYRREIKNPKSPLRFFANCLRFIAFRRSEQYLLSNFPVTTVVSSVDKEQLNKLNKEANVVVIPNGVDANYFSHQDKIQEDYPSILFSGAMSFPPNVEAALYICRELLPILRVEIPDIKFYIVGKDPSPQIKELARDDHIIVTGFVEDIRTYILKANVVLAPMRSGSGIKNKILEAMALGKPVVTNPMGAEWLDYDGRDIVSIGETAQELAENVVELLSSKSLRQTTGEKARQYVKNHYTWQNCAQAYENLYKQIIKG